MTLGQLHSLGGALAVDSAAIFLLDKTGNVPIEPLPSIAPGLTPFRSTWDAVETESYDRTYTVTQHAIQSVGDVASHVRPELRSVTVTGVIVNELSIPFGRQVPIVPGVRLDVFRAQNFEELAKRRALVMLVTPRIVLHRAFITGVSRPWSPDDGESSRVSVSFIEARVVSPLTGQDVIPDDPSLDSGNVRDVGGGAQQGTQIGTVNATAAPAPYTSPVISPFGGLS